MPVIRHAAELGYLFKIDPRAVLGAPLSEQVILAAAGLALAEAIAEARRPQ